jgi:hypothetical protein
MRAKDVNSLSAGRQSPSSGNLPLSGLSGISEPLQMDHRCDPFEGWWAHQDLNLGPRDYESRKSKRSQHLCALHRDCFWCVAKCVSKYTIY